MVLLVVNSVCLGEPNTIIQTPDPEEVDYNMSLACYRAAYNDFPRRQYMSCINRNANVSNLLSIYNFKPNDNSKIFHSFASSFVNQNVTLANEYVLCSSIS